MKNKTATFEANLFNFQLKNTADECGFKADDSWIIVLADEQETNRIMKNYIPSVTSLLAPNILVEVYKQVKMKVDQAEDPEVAALTKKDVERLKLNHIVAYNEKRAVR